MFRAIHGALEQVDNTGDHFHILNWSTIRDSKDYQDARRALELLYWGNEDFRKLPKVAVSAYLAPKLEGVTMTDEKHIGAGHRHPRNFILHLSLAAFQA